ncbi:glutathione S-transferase [Aliikangiella sp. IMCC44359]|uniref:glutathione S-transferase n=1 Tax=Aliikangiella sp. IMCC44359 TaxID=3459125 RepID=UPI00403AD05A
MALFYSEINIELREVHLKNKPESMLAISAKGTVPILLLTDGKVIEESREIMLWALKKNNPDDWLVTDKQSQIKSLIDFNDSQFKLWLDRYKYSIRYPENSKLYYREQAEIFLMRLENNLTKYEYLLGPSISLADIAIFPFIRQFAFVDKGWFDNSNYINLKKWLNRLMNSELFNQIMHKYQPWKLGNPPITMFNK